MTSEETTAAATESHQEPRPDGRNLLERQVESLRRSLAEGGLEQAFDRHGFALFHSLPKEQQLLIREEMGALGKDPVTQYNLGVAYGANEDLKKAISCWKQALKGDPELVEAQFNIALAYERLGNRTSARKHFGNYLKAIEDPEEIQAVEEHLSQMEG